MILADADVLALVFQDLPEHPSLLGRDLHAVADDHGVYAAVSNFLYLNDGAGRFKESSLTSGVGFSADGEAEAADPPGRSGSGFARTSCPRWPMPFSIAKTRNLCPPLARQGGCDRSSQGSRKAAIKRKRAASTTWEPWEM